MTSYIHKIEGEEQKEGKRAKTPTPSEAARHAAQDAAVDEMHEKERQVQDAQHRLEHWAEYYDEEYRAYCKCVDEGKMHAARTCRL